MVHEYVVDLTRRCVRVRLSGVLTGAALLSTFIDVQWDPRVTEEFCALIDLRDIRSVDDLRYEEARELATSPHTLARRAFIAHHPAVFGFCRMFATCRELAAREPVGVFRSVRDAEGWLGLSADTDEA